MYERSSKVEKERTRKRERDKINERDRENECKNRKFDTCSCVSAYVRRLSQCVRVNIYMCGADFIYVSFEMRVRDGVRGCLEKKLLKIGNDAEYLIRYLIACCAKFNRVG